MNVGVSKVSLRIPENMDLKGKRQVLKSITSRVRNKFNVSVAEVEHQDLWQRSKLAIVCVNTQWTAIENILDKIVRIMQSDPRFTLLNSEIQKIY
jgi:uncharacterized protein YlxP (DUF503 family)